MDCSYKSITNCTFSHVQFNNCKLKATHFTDVRFEHCDLSNISFAESFRNYKKRATNKKQTLGKYELS